MTAPSGIRQGVGFRHIQILALDTSGYPAASSTTVYEGVQISGAKSLTINDPEPRQIVHTGDDRVLQLDVLPPTEPISGELNAGKANDTVDAILSPVKSATVGEAKIFAVGHDQRGNENQVAILAYRQSLEADPSDANYGKRLWEFRLLPRAYVIQREGNLDENPEARTYAVRPQLATKHVWGASLSTATEGVSMAQAFRGISEYKPKIVAFKGNNTATQFSLPASSPAISTAKMAVWSNGVSQTSGAVTLGTATVTFTTAPTTGAMVVVFYEHA